MCCHGVGEAWKEEVIPKTVGPVPTQDCGAWPHGSSLKEFTKTLDLEILKSRQHGLGFFRHRVDGNQGQECHKSTRGYKGPPVLVIGSNIFCLPAHLPGQATTLN